jgi:alpha-ketoglutaric semialdehyde dehydrogenase
MKRAALLLIDLQQDFLTHPALEPPAESLVAAIARALQAFRSAGLPVLHVHTVVRPDGADRMPHWAARDFRGCIEGSVGAQPPAELAPLPRETVVRKRFFSAFTDDALHAALSAAGVDCLVLAGVHLHGCVRATAFDAYERGYEVLIGEDLVGSYSPLQAAAARAYLAGRAASLLPAQEILERLGLAPKSGVPAGSALPAACIDHRWIQGTGRSLTVHRDPSRSVRISSQVAHAEATETAAAAAAAARAQGPWERLGLEGRLQHLAALESLLRERRTALETLLIAEIGKPLRDAREEITRTLGHLEAVRDLPVEAPVGSGITVRYRPVGCIGLITPWNNPVALAISKIAAALFFGNTVVWKPSPLAARISMALMEALIDAGLPPGVVNLVCGDSRTAGELIDATPIARVSLTGSIAAGQAVAARCALHGKPMQGELGGNNALVVLDDADFEAHMPFLAAAAFGFAGQRCTAMRRFIVARSRIEEFASRFVAATLALTIGEPASPDTDIGPLISEASVARLERVCLAARDSGARILTGGARPPGFNHGAWFAPTVITNVERTAPVSQTETFGPLAILLPAADPGEALAILNDVPQGLIAGLMGGDRSTRERFADEARAGILNFRPGPVPVHPAAPFGGWKASGYGPPEHGIWDREFYALPQTVYHAGAGV